MNSLADYMASLDKVSHLAVTCPALTPEFSGDLKSRIDALKIHHRERAEEVLEVLGNKTLNAYEIAAGMTWDIDCETWEDFPIAQKWFATGKPSRIFATWKAKADLPRRRAEDRDLFRRPSLIRSVHDPDDCARVLVRRGQGTVVCRSLPDDLRRKPWPALPRCTPAFPAPQFQSCASASPEGGRPVFLPVRKGRSGRGFSIPKERAGETHLVEAVLMDIFAPSIFKGA